jgi:hypothetical protein
MSGKLSTKALTGLLQRNGLAKTEYMEKLTSSCLRTLRASPFGQLSQSVTPNEAQHLPTAMAMRPVEKKLKSTGSKGTTTMSDQE